MKIPQALRFARRACSTLIVSFLQSLVTKLFPDMTTKRRRAAATLQTPFARLDPGLLLHRIQEMLARRSSTDCPGEFQSISISALCPAGVVIPLKALEPDEMVRQGRRK
jgi:hypothetical protein